jgi:indolepyruvate decarboxylase
VLGPKDRSITFKVRTEIELEEALILAEQNYQHLVFIEVMMHRDDKPALLAELSKRFANQNV